MIDGRTISGHDGEIEIHDKYMEDGTYARSAPK
jgi:hypothetical protein